MTEKKFLKMQQDLEREQAKSRVLMELTRHIGRGRAIGMGELYEKIFSQPWSNRINDTRPLRRLITSLRYGENPQPICSVCCAIGPGYYLASAGSELKDYIARIKKQGLKKLALAAKLEKMPLPDLLGQMALELRRSE